MFSSACEYGLKAVIFLASRADSGCLTNVSEISEAIDSPKPFTAKILQKLVKERIIDSVKGAHGGFYIEQKRLKNLTTYDVVLALDGDALLKRCVLGLSQCSDANPCPMHNKYKFIRTDIARMLHSSLISNLSKDILKELYVLQN